MIKKLFTRYVIEDGSGMPRDVVRTEREALDKAIGNPESQYREVDVFEARKIRERLGGSNLNGLERKPW